LILKERKQRRLPPRGGFASMKTTLKVTAAVLALAGASLLGTGPASAGVSFGITVGVPNAVVVDADSGGYCDEWGCPDEYWDMPVWYGPVYYDGRWFNGPVYYRDFGGQRLFWVRGGWRRDGWRGPRPSWWRADYRFGPALGYEFYLGHGFRHGRDRFWRGNDWRPGREWDRNRWEREHGGERMHPDHESLTGRVHAVIGGHDGDHHDTHDHGGGMGSGSHGGGGSSGGGGGSGSHGGGSSGGGGSHGGGGSGSHSSGGSAGSNGSGHKPHGN
jgi:hypothetical protein